MNNKKKLMQKIVLALEQQFNATVSSTTYILRDRAEQSRHEVSVCVFAGLSSLCAALQMASGKSMPA